MSWCFGVGANTDTYNELSVTIASMTAASIGVGGTTTFSAADLGASTTSATNVGATVGGLTTVTTGQADVASVKVKNV